MLALSVYLNKEKIALNYLLTSINSYYNTFTDAKNILQVCFVTFAGHKF